MSSSLQYSRPITSTFSDASFFRFRRSLARWEASRWSVRAKDAEHRGQFDLARACRRLARSSGSRYSAVSGPSHAAVLSRALTEARIGSSSLTVDCAATRQLLDAHGLSNTFSVPGDVVSGLLLLSALRDPEFLAAWRRVRRVLLRGASVEFRSRAVAAVKRGDVSAARACFRSAQRSRASGLRFEDRLRINRLVRALGYQCCLRLLLGFHRGALQCVS